MIRTVFFIAVALGMSALTAAVAHHVFAPLVAAVQAMGGRW
jgi:hypothetical protein